jgi:hypothetical protein
MDEIAPISCNLCVFYSPGKLDIHQGVCHRVPLHPLFNQKTQTVMHVMTFVPEDYWCGEFRESIIDEDHTH